MSDVRDKHPMAPRVVHTATLSHRGLLAVAAALAIGFLLVFGALIYVYFDLRGLSRKNEDAISQLNRLTHPTPEQFRQDFKNGIKRCLAEPSCARIFPGLRRDRQRAQHARRRLAAHEAAAARQLALVYARREGQPTPTFVSPTPMPTLSPQPPAHHHPHKSKPTGGGSGSGGGSTTPSPPPSPSTVTVQTHLPAPLPNPSICTQVVKLNC